MPLENLEGPDVFVDDLNNAWPLGSDTPQEGDDHLRGIKNVLRNWAGTYGNGPLSDLLTAAFAPLVHTHLWEDITDKPATFPPAAHTHVADDITDLDDALAPYAPLADPDFSGTPTLAGAPLATQAYVQGEVHKAFRSASGSTTLQAADLGKTVWLTSAGSVTVPPNSSVAFAVGSRVNVGNASSGAVTITPGSGVTLRSKDGALSLADQYAGVTLEKVATNEWWLVGDLS